MKLPANLKPVLQGAAGGAIGMAILGFTWGGWVTGSAAEALAAQKLSAAVIASLAPICHENFRRGKDSAAQLIELKKASSWEQATLVEKGGWATMAGTATVDSSMARACAALIIADKT
jgi:alpha/beta superfamily hydrolase